MNTLIRNPILDTDSYKASHFALYPKDIIGMQSYIESRTNGRDIIIPFGLQAFILRYLTQPITLENINEAEQFLTAHGEPFNRKGWELILSRYGGYMPVKIKAVPEGMPVRSGNAIVTIEYTDRDLWWVVSYLETAILRAVWYPTTLATKDYELKNIMAQYYKHTGADLALLPFAAHCFGARGVSSYEGSELAGARLVNFMGSDTMAGIRWVNHYYREPMAGFSVPASEHSIECSYGPNNENEYLEKVLDTYAKPGSIVSIVIDGYDVYRAAEALCTKFKEKIIGSKAKVVFRPDSGDINTVVLRLLALQESVFGYDLTSSGYKKIRHVGVIQGDGVNQEAIISLFEKMIKDGYSVDNVVFGSGGAMLQGINRDTLKFAQKACAILRSSDNEWQPIFKDPITDSGKKSKAGYLSLFKDRVTGEIMTMVNKDVNPEYYSEVLQVVYENGTVKNLTTLSEVRERCKI